MGVKDGWWSNPSIIALMQKGELLAEGRMAEVYEWEDGWVLKLLRAEWNNRETAENEANKTRLAHATGYRTPAVGEVVEVDGRVGTLYERFDGVVMGQALSRDVMHAKRYARRLAELHAEMHTYQAPGLPSRKESLIERIASLTQLSPKTKHTVLDLLNTLPDGEALLHGDFHPGNIILSGGDALVIDWIDASKGPPLADVARTYILLTSKKSKRVTLFGRIVLFLRDSFQRTYLKRYFQLRPAGHELLDAWVVCMAAARIWEGIADREGDLIEMVESGLAKL
ncbi:MAG: phosphotransferase [Anaerolineales bacterium]|nr:phosphotransferase [Anaerolineales bacterium]